MSKNGPATVARFCGERVALGKAISVRMTVHVNSVFGIVDQEEKEHSDF